MGMTVNRKQKLRPREETLSHFKTACAATVVWLHQTNLLMCISHVLVWSLSIHFQGVQSEMLFDAML